jgi:tripartite-type tricarboxylate transporter receptor subunit TctC
VSTIRTIAKIATLLLLVAAAPAVALDWPTRSVTLVVPFAPGGSTDTIARILAEGLRTQLGQSVVVENISGAGGMIGSGRVAKAPPDGYEFVLGNVGTHSQSQSIYKKPLYDAATDFAPVALVSYEGLVLIARKDFPADNLQQFITYATANQASMHYGSGGVGGSNHLACALLNSVIGINVAHVPYRGGGPALQDLMAGRMDYQCASMSAALPFIEGKAVKPIAILGKARSASLPDLPTAQEQGLADFDDSSWYALFLPKATPAEIVEKLNRAVVAVLRHPSVQERLKDIGSDLVPPEEQTPDFLGKFVAAEVKKSERAIRASGVQLE